MTLTFVCSQNWIRSPIEYVIPASTGVIWNRNSGIAACGMLFISEWPRLVRKPENQYRRSTEWCQACVRQSTSYLCCAR